MNEKKKDVVVAFRLAHDEFEPFRAVLEKSTMSKSAFFRMIFLAHKKELFLKEKPSTDLTKLLFTISRMSNNINQLTRRIHLAENNNTITHETYMKLLNQLVGMNQLLSGVIDAGKS